MTADAFARMIMETLVIAWVAVVIGALVLAWKDSRR